MPIPTSDPIVNIPVVTPFDERDQLDHDALAANIQRWRETPAGCFLVGSETGEEQYLSEGEKVAAVRTVRQALDGERCVMAGIDCPSVTETLRRAEAFAEVGAELVRIRMPRERPLVEPYFAAVLPRCPVPVLIMHQSNPQRFGLAGEPAADEATIGRVCGMEHVFGYTTDHDVRFEARVRRHVPDDRRFWICNGSLILHGVLIGCNGTTCAFANIWPTALHDLLTLGRTGRFEEARLLQEQVQRIDAVMLPFRAAGVKAALGRLGFEGMRVRAPQIPMPADAVARLEQEMHNAGLV